MTVPRASASPSTMASTISPDSATPGGTGRPARVASPSPTALAPENASSWASTSGTTDLTDPSSRVDVDFAGVAIDTDVRTVGNELGRVARADDAGDAVLASDDRRVRH